MTGAIVLGLIIVLWIFVLAPLALRGHRPVTRAGDGLDDTTVVYEGGSAVPGHRRPRFRADDVRAYSDDDADTVDADYVDADYEPAAVSVDDDIYTREDSTVQAVWKGLRRWGKNTQDEQPDTVTTVTDLRDEAEEFDGFDYEAYDTVTTARGVNGYDAESTTSAQLRLDALSADAIDDRAEDPRFTDADRDGDTYVLDESYVGPADVLHPEATYDYPADLSPVAQPRNDSALDIDNDADTADDAAEGTVTTLESQGVEDADTDLDDAESVLDADHSADRDDSDAAVAEHDNTDDTDAAVATVAQADSPLSSWGLASKQIALSDEDREFALRRRGRGSYDPVAEAQRNEKIYRRRKIMVASLLALTLITLVIAALVGGSSWFAPVIAAALTAAYLFALRRIARKEHERRLRRIEQITRARLGVRASGEDYIDLPERLRFPGAVVVEVDDENPDFFHLPAADPELVAVVTGSDDEPVVELSSWQKNQRRVG